MNTATYLRRSPHSSELSNPILFPPHSLELLTDRLFVSGSSAGSDYMSWTRAGYPSAFAAEGDPAVGKFPGNFEHYVHTIGDRMDIDDETGVFSIEVSIHWTVG